MTLVSQFGNRKTIRQAVGRNTGKMVLVTASANGTDATFVTTDLFGGSSNTYKGRRWLGTDAPNDEIKSRVISTAVASDIYTLTLSPVVTSTVLGDTAELWEMDPEEIGSGSSAGGGYINQAIREITGLAFDPEESLALHGDTRETRFDIPDQFAEIHSIDYRSSVESVVIHEATSAWDESVDSDVTTSKDSEDYKYGGASFKMVVAATASANDILATKKISVDLSGMDYVEFWIKSSVATSAGGLQLLLDSVASCLGSPSATEELNVPALTANVGTYVRVALANPSTDTAIISVGLKYVTDIGAATIWLNDVKGTLNSSAHWTPLHKRLWGIDIQARDLVLTNRARASVGYSLMKISGGDKPVLLNADATASEVDDWYVICRATALTLRAHPQEGKDPNYWDTQAQIAKLKHHRRFNSRNIG